jgi:hypothetical protein
MRCILRTSCLPIIGQCSQLQLGRVRRCRNRSCKSPIRFTSARTDNDAVTWFGRSLNHYLRVSDETTIGALFSMIKITARNGVQCCGRKTVELKNDGVAYELWLDGSRNRWVQRSLTTGEAIELPLPWEVTNRKRRIADSMTCVPGQLAKLNEFELLCCGQLFLCYGCVRR